LHDVVFARDGLHDAAPPDDVFARAEAVASAVPAGSRGAMFFPWLAGSIAPAPDDDVRGGFAGVDLSTTRAEMTRAVYEGVALNAAWLLGPFSEFTGVEYDAMTFGGGGARSALWGDLLADACGITIERLAEPECTNARGAALLAFGVLGLVDPDTAGSTPRVAQVHRPDPARRAVYAGLVERFAAFHAAVQPWYRRPRP